MCPICTQRWLPQAIRRGSRGSAIACRKDSSVANMNANIRFSKLTEASTFPGFTTAITGCRPSDDIATFQRTHCSLGPSTGSQFTSVDFATRWRISRWPKKRVPIDALFAGRRYPIISF
eukprot:4469075-Pyramimonas_sp.AAC.1